MPGETLCRAASGDQVPSQTLVVLDENLMVGRVAEAAISPSMTGGERLLLAGLSLAASKAPIASAGGRQTRLSDYSGPGGTVKSP